MSDAKRAFVLMPFSPPFDSYYPHIFTPALEAAGFSVSRADDLFTPHPIMLDIQQSIVQADLILCEMSGRNPNVFYELGLAHAIGKPAILISRKHDDIPFDFRHLRVILYDYTEAGWESKLRDAIKRAAESAAESPDRWPPPLVPGSGLHVMRAFAGEVAVNLHAIDRFLAEDYAVSGDHITSKGHITDGFDYVTCSTAVFESISGREAIQSAPSELRDRLIRVYDGFRRINDRADALKAVFRPWRAQHYLQAIEDFARNLRRAAEELAKESSAGTAGVGGGL
jgi:hypothetical protein